MRSHKALLQPKKHQMKIYFFKMERKQKNAQTMLTFAACF